MSKICSMPEIEKFSSHCGQMSSHNSQCLMLSWMRYSPLWGWQTCQHSWCLQESPSFLNVLLLCPWFVISLDYPLSYHTDTNWGLIHKYCVGYVLTVSSDLATQHNRDEHVLASLSGAWVPVLTEVVLYSASLYHCCHRCLNQVQWKTDMPPNSS